MALTATVTEHDDAFCRRMLPQVSRTFALSIEALPESLRAPIRTAYLLCRVVDTIEDAAHTPLALRAALFDAFDRAMRDDSATVDPLEDLAQRLDRAAESDLELTRHAGRVFRCYRELPAGQREDLRGPILEMSAGMRQYSRRQASDADGKLRIRSVDDLEEYCYYVAGTVGKLLTALFLRDCPQPEERARELRLRQVPFGLGLQMVNILKDVAEDAEREVAFLPEDLMAERGLQPGTLLDPERRDDALAVLHAVAARARQHLDTAFEYTSLWPADRAAHIRMFTIVPQLLADASLLLVERGGADVMARGRVPKVSRAFVGYCVQHSRSAATDQHAFESLRASIHAGDIAIG